jgi:type I restriction enzyme S subunit
MSAGLLEHFERLAEAPGAIPRLRRLVLDLAVRGKLVAQDSAEEPASVLLERIAAERAKSDRKPKSVEGITVSETEKHPIPNRWRWSTLSEVAECLNYKRIPVNSTERDARIAGKAEDELYPYYGATQQQGWIDSYLFDEEIVLLGEDGVPFLEPLRNKAYIVREKCWVNNHAHVFRPVLMSGRFLCHHLNVFDYSDRIAGATRSKLNLSKAISIPIPIPPLAEQYRIVAKVDELMSLLDQIEAAQATREATRQQLATASLARMSSATNDTDFQTSADFLLQTLPTHTTRREQIKQLRQTILNLAVRGRLGTDTGEAGSDERASAHHELPPPWRFIPLCDLLAEDTRNGYSRRPDDAEDGIPILRISAGTIRPDGVVAEEEHKRISSIDDNTRKQYGLKKGDLLACRFNGNKSFVGRLTIFLDYLSLDPIYPDKLIRVRLNPQVALPEFIRMAGDSDIVRSSIEQSCATTVGNWGISASNLKEIRFPLPPLAEQHRIVAKVDELMALCDRIDTALAQAEVARARLLDAELHAALQNREVA